MPPLPATDLRSNLGTWMVPPALVPAVAHSMTESLPVEVYDPSFRGQALETTYFDTDHRDLRRARKRGDRYLTLRLRRYRDSNVYALSAKTEDAKVRIPVDAATAARLLNGRGNLPELLPDDLLSRLIELTEDRPLTTAVCVSLTRFAVEDDIDRLTFDIGIATDTGKQIPASVLEFKSQLPGCAPPPWAAALALRPARLSKFLWATRT